MRGALNIKKGVISLGHAFGPLNSPMLEGRAPSGHHPAGLMLWVSTGLPAAGIRVRPERDRVPGSSLQRGSHARLSPHHHIQHFRGLCLLWGAIEEAG